MKHYPPAVKIRMNTDRTGPDFQDKGPCWIWIGAKVSRYAQMRLSSNKTGRVHIVSWELVNGPVPEGLELDHLCRNRYCCNPKHLEPVTHAENMARAFTDYKHVTHCKHGHEYTPDNTAHFTPRGCNKPRRVCRACARVTSLAAWRKKHGKGVAYKVNLERWEKSVVMEITCGNCQSPIFLNEEDLESGEAKCGRCSQGHDLTKYEDLE